MNHIFCLSLLLVFANLLSPAVYSEDAIKESPYQPKKYLPNIAVVKYDESKPNILQVRIAEIRYHKVQLSYTENGQIKTADVINKYPGKMVPLDLLLSDIQFFQLDGSPIEESVALQMLQSPTHIFLYQAPDQFHRAICNPKLLVIKAREGKPVPHLPVHFD